MERALDLAARARGRTSPNPLVGAVVVAGGTVVGEGWHRRAGEPHAEREALAMAGERAAGADLYVTLEPCCHWGRTPPCTDAIVAAGIGTVYAAIADPNPVVDGRGFAALRERGIRVETGLLSARARRLNEAYLTCMEKGRPFVLAKVALSLDGRLAAGGGDAAWISNQESRRRAHRLRALHDAVMVGVGTLLADDPLLTPRLEDWDGPLPARVVVDSRLRSPPGSRIFSGGPPVLVAAAPGASARRRERLAGRGATVLTVPSREGRVDLDLLLGELAGRGITSVMVEGGGTLVSALLRLQLVDKVTAFVAPLFIGGRGRAHTITAPGARRIDEALRLEEVTVEALGDNAVIEGYPRWEGRCSPD
jgi:diaminohydroxyphosphoribosylaminopyrimidine deaminase/5-amino-6-(5-phosphoribosylamino)uracil reductase